MDFLNKKKYDSGLNIFGPLNNKVEKFSFTKQKKDLFNAKSSEEE